MTPGRNSADVFPSPETPSHLRSRPTRRRPTLTLVACAAPPPSFPAQTQRLPEGAWSRRKFSRYGKVDISGSGIMAGSYPEGVPTVAGGERQQFGTRFLSDPARIFHHNAW